MIRHVIIHIIAVTGLLVWGSCIPASARISAQNDSWGSTSSFSSVNRPAYTQTPSTSGGYKPAYNAISAYDPSFHEGVKASSYFQYTPADALLSDNSSDNGMHRSIRRGWDDPDDDPVGVLPNPAPVGEPLVLLLMALLYAIGMRLRTRLSRQTPR